jgi:hypothetical protein
MVRFYLKAWVRALPGEFGFAAVVVLAAVLLQLFTGGPALSGGDGAAWIGGSWLALTAGAAAGTVLLEALAWRSVTRRIEREHGKTIREILDGTRGRHQG